MIDAFKDDKFDDEDDQQYDEDDKFGDEVDKFGDDEDDEQFTISTQLGLDESFSNSSQNSDMMEELMNDNKRMRIEDFKTIFLDNIEQNISNFQVNQKNKEFLTRF